MRASAIKFASLIVFAAFLTCNPVLAADDMRTYAAGDPVYISGTAPGAQSTGLAAWIFGPNYWKLDYFDIEEDGSYTYEIDGGVTGSLSPGEYFVVIQHPMYNGVFDVTTQAGVPGSGQTSVVSNAGNRFIIDGPGKLEGSAAAYALMNMLDSPDIDDTYTTTSFYLDEPWIRSGSGDSFPLGSVFMLDGTTNIASGEKLIYTFYPASGDIPSSKGDPGTAYTTEMSGSAYVDYGSPYNTWEVAIDTSGMDPGSYIFTIQTVEGDNTAQKFITLYEQEPTPEETVPSTPIMTAGTVTATESATAVPAATSAPLSSITVIAGIIITAVAATGGFDLIRGRNRS